MDSVNNAVQNDSGASLPVLAIGWHRWDRNGTSTARKAPWTRWTNGGTGVGYGVAGAYSRGNQGTIDTFQAHYCSAVTLDLANGADLKFQAQDEAYATTQDMGIYASTNRYFLGVQVLNLESLVTAGGTTGQIKYYNGSSWDAKPVKTWSGSAWETKPLKRWNGSSWEETDY